MILGYGPFILQPWVGKSYKDAALNEKQSYFNYGASSAIMVAEDASGTLNTRFCILHMNYESSKEAAINNGSGSFGPS